MCIKVIFSIRRIGNMYLRYFLSWLFSGGRDSFFIFFWLHHTLLLHIPFAAERPSCFCPQGAFLPAFLPASCFPLQPEQTPDGCFAQSRLLNFRSWPSTQGFLARHWLLFAASMSSGCGWPADFMPALRGEYACLRLADTSFRSPSLRVLLFHYCFWPKSQSFSATKIVCGRERLDKP